MKTLPELPPTFDIAFAIMSITPAFFMLPMATKKPVSRKMV